MMMVSTPQNASTLQNVSTLQNITNNFSISNIFWGNYSGNYSSYDDVDDFQNEDDCIILCSIFFSIFIIIICFYFWIFIKECRNTDQDALYESLV